LRAEFFHTGAASIPDMHIIIHHDAALLEPCSYKRTLGCLRGWAPEHNLFTERTSLEQTAPCLRFWVPDEFYIRGGEIATIAFLFVIVMFGVVLIGHTPKWPIYVTILVWRAFVIYTTIHINHQKDAPISGD
jgi:hypothetical protein